MNLESDTPKNHKLINKALDYAEVGVTITDPTLEDNPIVYVNNGFLKMTGYSEEELIGKNCRLLQGQGTDKESVRKIREAIDNRNSIKTQLLNYRKDGTEFWNELTIEPLWMEEEGKLYFVGLQKDVTEDINRQKQLSEFTDEMYKLSTPIVPVRDGLSILPIIGTLTEVRFENLISTVSTYITDAKDDYFIIDLSGLVEVDSFVADAIFKLNNLINLTGTELIVTGIKPNLAMAMAQLHVEFKSLKTYMNVKSALKQIK
ncbi:PAS domain-containing protein [Bacillus gobiensis]|uniref:STAS domain-containing protein n=1 Tax=Bacillus gobiensis TaxID=1441095 RepID=UPI003D25BD4F